MEESVTGTVGTVLLSCALAQLPHLPGLREREGWAGACPVAWTHGRSPLPRMPSRPVRALAARGVVSSDVLLYE